MTVTVDMVLDGLVDGDTVTRLAERLGQPTWPTLDALNAAWDERRVSRYVGDPSLSRHADDRSPARWWRI